MFRTIGVVVTAVLLGWGVSEATQAKQGKKCGGKQTRGMYCEKDGALVDAKEIKGGKHTACDSKVISVAVCVKTSYACAGKGDKNCGAKSDKRGSCECKRTMKAVKGEPSLVTWKCSGCEQSAVSRTAIKHDKEKDKTAKRKTVTAACSH